MKKRTTETSVYRSLAVITQFGINMLVPILGMSAVGYFLDKKFETSYWFILCFFVGAVAGFQNVYRFAMKIARKPSERKNVSDMQLPELASEETSGEASEEASEEVSEEASEEKISEDES